MTDPRSIGKAMERLCQIMEQLRSPSGCPWDADQTNASLQPFLIEEAYEVIEAIQQENNRKLCEELGDLLLQIVFHAQICAESGAFSFADVATAIADKLVSRHPHVFSADADRNAGQHEFAWDRIKQRERRASGEDTGLLAGLPQSLPALQRAQKVLAKTTRYGLPIDQLLTDHSLLSPGAEQVPGSSQDLAGQLLSLTLSVHTAGHNAEQLLRDASRQIEVRFTALEQNLAAAGRDLQGLTEDEWRLLWGTT